MAAINRYSKPVQVAKFDPLTAQDVLTIPMAKQALEDKQIEEGRAYLKELYNTRYTAADSEVVTEARQALEGKLNNLTNQITTKGVNSRNTADFNKLKDEYTKALSLSGDIGQANDFYTQKQAAYKNFMNNPSSKAWGADRLNAYWEQMTKDRSAFNADGTYNTEFAPVGVPINVDAAAELNKIKLGKTGDFINATKLWENNSMQIDKAKKSILRKYMTPGTNENGSMILNGYNIKQIEAQLDNQGDAMLNSMTGSYIPKTSVESEIAKNKRIKAQKEAFDRKTENILSKQGTEMADFETPQAKTLNNAITTAAKLMKEAPRGTDGSKSPQLKAAEDNYMLAIQNYNTYKDYYIGDGTRTNGARLQRAKDSIFSGDLKNDLELRKVVVEYVNEPDKEPYYQLSSIDDISDTKEVPLTEKRGSGNFAGTTKTVHKVGKDITNTYNNISQDKLEAYYKANKAFEDDMDKVLSDENAGYKRINLYNIASNDPKVLTPKINTWKNGVVRSIHNDVDSYDIGNIVGMDGNKLTPYNSKKGQAALNRDVRSLLRQADLNEKGSVDIMSLISGTAQTGTGVKIKLKLPKKDDRPESFKDYEGKFIEINVGLSKIPSDNALRQFTTNLLSIGNDYTRDFAINEGTKHKYNDIITAPSMRFDGSFYNADNFIEYYYNKPDSKGAAMLIDSYKNTDGSLDKERLPKSDLYKAENGRYRLKHKVGNGGTYDFSVGELIRASKAVENNSKRDPKLNAYSTNYLKRIAEKDGAFNNIFPPGVQLTPTQVKGLEKDAFDRWMEKNKTNSDAVEVDHYKDIFKLLE